MILLSGCAEPVKFDVCQSRSDEGFIPPLSKELTRRGIEHEIRGGKLCYKSLDKDEVGRADTFVTSFRYGVATIIRDTDTEARIVAWLTKEQKSYEITETTDGDRFLIIHSDSEDDAANNRIELIRMERGE